MYMFIFFTVLNLSFSYDIFCKQSNYNEYCSNNTLWVDNETKECIVLLPNGRFITELYYLNDEGETYNGMFIEKSDTLILFSNQIIVNVFDPLKICSSELIKFVFYKSSDRLSLINVFKLRNNIWILETIDQEKRKISNFKLYTLNQIVGYKEFEWLYHYITKSQNETISDSYWINKEYGYCLSISEILKVEFYNFKKNETKRHGDIELSDEVKRMSLNNLDTITLFINDITYTGGFDNTVLKSVELMKWQLLYKDDKLILQNNFHINGILGSEIDYYDWYNFEDVDDEEYERVISSKIHREQNIDNMEFVRVSKEEYQLISKGK